ncbi:membrane peptidoglycan carboxypeptidase [Arthrobacter silviterrae]|uniref:Penicillin-binding protein n=1 Tax=Arthrobacter silviterrae TaxID=2026658 RepID=A0ABX0DM07_9MICC|nr:transglycosylase domain-containing protein [Arthrobacter silviterrae]MDQ0277490.1 membrane peptidoglycan carboxypeptidase [Arthrobacter silviterrae]NGN85278.1 penicillin-binding protein [Arthrobacter silviterrae]
MKSIRRPVVTTTSTLGRLLLLMIVSIACGALVAGLFTPATALAATVANNSINMFNQLPETLDVDPPAQTTKVLASDGSVIARFYAEDRHDVTLANMSPYIKNGIVAIEDARFYQHGGIDPTGILRAVVATVQGGREGASTITQQYVNNVIIQNLVSKGDTSQVKLGAQKTVGDKLKEMRMAIAMEKKYSKDQILQGYLNLIYFGNGAYGIQAAAKLYFNTDAKNLTLPQAAALAGVVNSPSVYDPVAHPDNVVTRRNEVLGKMLAQKKITQKQYGAAVKATLTVHLNKPSQGCVAAAMAPYFCDYVQQLVLNDPAFGATQDERSKFLYQGGLTIKTTLDPKLQQVAQDQVNATISATDPLQRGAAVVSVQPGTGKVLTMAQNTVYNPASKPGNYMGNFALPLNDAKGNSLHGAGGFQIGSTFKPIVYAEWLNSGHSMMTMVNGAVRDYPVGYNWKNSCGKTTGSYDPASGTKLLPNDDPNHYYPMTALEGLYNSINTITFQTAAALDFCNIQKMATAAGLADGATNKPYDVSKISNLIGSENVAPINMATMMATFASGGVRCDPIALTSITDNTGKSYPVPGANCQQTISKDVANGVKYTLQQMLVRGSGYLIPLNDKATAFAKTGTTDGNTNTWTIGANSGISTASWFGSYKGIGPFWVNQDITINGHYWVGVDGANLAGTQWAGVMNAAAGIPAYAAQPLEKPPATMLATTAPLVVGVNDPKGTDAPVQPVPPAPNQAPATTKPGSHKKK